MNGPTGVLILALSFTHSDHVGFPVIHCDNWERTDKGDWRTEVGDTITLGPGNSITLGPSLVHGTGELLTNTNKTFFLGEYPAVMYLNHQCEKELIR